MTGSNDSGGGEIDLVIFEVGGRTWGADVADVVQVGRRIGAKGSAERLRALYVRNGIVPIDRLVGVQRFPLQSLRPLPEFARGLVGQELVGFAVQEDGILCLIDLEALVEENRVGVPPKGLRATPQAPAREG